MPTTVEQTRHKRNLKDAPLSLRWTEDGQGFFLVSTKGGALFFTAERSESRSTFFREKGTGYYVAGEKDKYT